MNRRESLITLAAVASTGAQGAAVHPIQLHVNLDVDPAKEQRFLKTFREKFRPAISRQPGFVEVKLLRFRKAMVGAPAGNWNYRLLISFQTEEQRQAWVKTDLHQQVWPAMEAHFRGQKYDAMLYEVV
jgi:heme-degrading monooxygenase HmoA